MHYMTAAVGFNSTVVPSIAVALYLPQTGATRVAQVPVIWLPHVGCTRASALALSCGRSGLNYLS